MAQQTTRPNVLILLVDEQRYPVAYENAELRTFRREHLRVQETLRATGIEWHRHYVASTACAPSRASLFTGHYPSLHGVTQTDGAAKRADEPAMHWLAPDGVPTLGDYFRAVGYRTLYHGKWHVSHADLLDPQTRKPRASTDERGAPIASGVAAYEQAERLEPFGFSGWVGPEPHGARPSNSGLRRDPFFADQAIASLDRLDAQRRSAGADARPWLMVCSLVNPHDIVLFGLGWLRVRAPFEDGTVPAIDRPPTHKEDLRTKPTCHRSYVNIYSRLLTPQPTIGLYRRFYYYLHKLVDAQLMRVYERLRASSFFDDTIVVFTSDHGDLLGAHGGMHQKWHNAYEEAIRVPLIVSGPPLGNDPRAVNRLSSHADLVPTLLGLVGADPEAVQATMRRDHELVRPFVGRDLGPILRGGSTELPDEAVYFMTDDEISAGTRTRGPLGWEFSPVVQPNHVEAVVARMDGRLWKLVRYFDERGHAPEEHELYDLEADPFESHNLASVATPTAGDRRARARLTELLAHERAHKRLTP